MKLATSLVLIRSQRILFIMVWNISGEFFNLKNITVGLNNPSRVVNATFYLFPPLFVYYYTPNINLT